MINYFCFMNVVGYELFVFINFFLFRGSKFCRFFVRSYRRGVYGIVFGKNYLDVKYCDV